MVYIDNNKIVNVVTDNLRGINNKIKEVKNKFEKDKKENDYIDKNILKNKKKKMII